MNWQQLISNKRLGQVHRHTDMHEERSEFKRDYDRLVFSAPFRRMQNKTQVFPLPGSIFVHNRLTHSLEVSTVGKSLGTDISRRLIAIHPELRGTLFEEIGTIVSAACLAHDMGNPPFGHSGEKAIQTFFTEGKGVMLRNDVTPEFWSDITHFEGNANAFRLLTHHFLGRRQGGYLMTYTMLASIVKYPFVSELAGGHGKFGFFHSEQESYQTIAKELGIKQLSKDGEPLRYARHPLVYLVEAADDICYEIMDIEDSHKLKIITFNEASNALLGFFDGEEQHNILKRIADEGITDVNEQIVYMRACAVNKLEHECVETFVNHEQEILDGEFKGSLIENIEPSVRKGYEQCVKLSYDKIYQSKPVLDVELGGYKLMETLMETLVDAAVNPNRFHSQQIIRRFSSQYEIKSPDLQTRLMAVIDYISGMTDVYALDIYQKMCGISLPIV
ncbi:MAG: dGTP triphosphohydrolase [Prevotella sp.]|jgi:dGTPase